jgi:flagellum-specific peptidoglycan hydrolase FlgJ
MMASATTIANFIERIAPCAQNAYKLFGKVKPSVCIAMACVESAYGTSEIMRNHHAFLGFKVGTGKTATKYWPGTFFTSKTKEEYTIGQHSVIVSAFRSYPDTQTCILNFYELLNTSLYSRVKAEADYKTQMKQIKACGYMTSSTEVNSVLNLIEKYNLTKYDFNSGTPMYPVPTTTLKRGVKGESVKWLQSKLMELGYPVGDIDGVFGAITEQCVKGYQTDKFVDGIVGPLTLEKLKGGK